MKSSTYTQGKGGSTYSLNPEYQTWIGHYVVTEALNPQLKGHWYLCAVLRGACYSASQKMQQAFPELLLVRGWVTGKTYAANLEPGEMMDPGDGHWWLETVDGEIVDPTRLQYGSQELHYHPMDESQAHLLPTGKCPNCGDYCYEGKDVCSDECGISYAAYLMAEVRS